MHLGCTEPSRTWPTQDPPNALSSSTSRQWPSSVAASTNTKTRTPYSHPTLRPDSGSLLLPRWGRGKVRHRVEWYTPLCTLTRWTPKASWTACVDPVRRSKILPPAILMWDPVLCRWIWVPRMMRRRPHRNCRRRRRSLGRRYGRLQAQTGLMGLLVEDCNVTLAGGAVCFPSLYLPRHVAGDLSLLSSHFLFLVLFIGGLLFIVFRGPRVHFGQHRGGPSGTLTAIKPRGNMVATVNPQGLKASRVIHTSLFQRQGTKADPSQRNIYRGPT